MSWPAAAELRGTHAALVPLHRDHAAALAEAVRDGELWHLWYTAVPPLVGALLKNEQDVTLFEKLVFMQRHNR